MELKQGINCYRVYVIHLKEKDADLLIGMLEEKRQSQRLSRSDLAELLLTPLMSGKQDVSERIEKSVRLIQQERDLLGKEDLLRMESVLYTFAMKFLSKVELENICLLYTSFWPFPFCPFVPWAFCGYCPGSDSSFPACLLPSLEMQTGCGKWHPT